MNTQYMDIALKTAERIANIGEAARLAFVERNDAIDALTTCLASGEHGIMLGKPGTSKTALGNYFAQAMGIAYYYQQGNPDVTREDVLGPISTAALRQDKWDREWSGLAVADLGFFDEIGKASGQVQNLLLGAMEERTASIANTIHKLPLHCLMSGSNETINNNPAIWDRFTVRLLLEYVKDTGNFVRMLRTDLTPPDHPVNREELAVLRHVTSQMALQANDQLDQKLVQIKGWIETQYTHKISDRRWRRSLKVAAGSALLRGSDTIEVIDMTSLKWLLWDKPDQIDPIYRYVEEQCNIELRDFKEIEALINALSQDVVQSLGDQKEITKFGRRISDLEGRVKQHTGRKWEPLKEKVSELGRKLEALAQIGIDNQINELIAKVDSIKPGETDSTELAKISHACGLLERKLENMNGQYDSQRQTVKNMIQRVLDLSIESY